MVTTNRIVWVMVVVYLCIGGWLYVIGPIAQDTSYHVFRDQRGWRGVPNVWNIFSNIPFLVIAVMALLAMRRRRLVVVKRLQWLYGLFFAAVALVAFGSGYYHWAPNNDSLLWDRLPMSIAFMTLFCVVVGEYVSVSWAIKLAFPLVAFGVCSVVYWFISESYGQGDLRLYVLVQFLPLLWLPMFLWFFSPTFSHSYTYWGILVAYAVSKACEYLDADIYALGLGVSGHTLKHLVIALGLMFLLRGYFRRSAV